MAIPVSSDVFQPVNVSFSPPPEKTAAPSPTTVVYVDASIHGRNRRCLIDTGAGVSLIPPSLVDGHLVSSEPIPLEVADGSVIHTSGTAKMEVSLGDDTLPHTFHVADVTTDIILGVDILFSERTLTWITPSKLQAAIPIVAVNTTCKVALANDVVVLKNCSEIIVMANLLDENKHRVLGSRNAVFEPSVIGKKNWRPSRESCG
jgi:hypothetical protein